MNAIVDLTATKAALQELLGSKYPFYLSLVRDWFKGRLVKTRFDEASEKLLTSEYMYLHNHMIVGMLEKCCAAASSGPSSSSCAGESGLHAGPGDAVQPHLPGLPGGVVVKQERLDPVDARKESPAVDPKRSIKNRKKSSRSPRLSFEPRFKPVDPIDILMSTRGPLDTPKHGKLQHQFSLHFAVRERCLLDPFLIHGRILTIAYEKDIVDVDDSVAELVTLAVRQALKNIFQSVVESRRSYLAYGAVHHSFGACGSTFGDPYLRQNPFKRHKPDGLFSSAANLPAKLAASAAASDAKDGDATELDLLSDADEVQFPTFPMPREAGVQRAATLAAASSTTRGYDPGRVTVWDLLDTLQRDPGCLPTFHIKYLAGFAASMRMRPVPWSSSRDGRALRRPAARGRDDGRAAEESSVGVNLNAERKPPGKRAIYVRTRALKM